VNGLAEWAGCTTCAPSLRCRLAVVVLLHLWVPRRRVPYAVGTPALGIFVAGRLRLWVPRRMNSGHTDPLPEWRQVVAHFAGKMPV